VAAGEQGNLPKSLSLLQRAWELKKSYDIAGNLGITETKLKMWPQAAEHLSFAIATFPATAAPDHRKKLEKRLAEVRKQVVAVTVRCGVEGATVRVGTRIVGETPLQSPVFLPAGTSNLEVSAPGYETERRIIKGEAGASLTVSIELRLKASDRSYVPEIVLGSVALVGIGVGAGFLAAASGKRGDADDKLAAMQEKAGYDMVCPKGTDNPDCATIKGLREDHDTFQIVGAVSLGIGGAALAAGLAHFLLVSDGEGSEPEKPGGPSKKASMPLDVTPWADARGGGGLAVGGRF